MHQPHRYFWKTGPLRSCRTIGRLLLSTALALVLIGCSTSSRLSADEATQLTQDAILIDTHIDVPFRLFREYEDVGVATPSGDFDYPRAVRGGLDGIFMSIYVPADVDAAGGAKAAANTLIDLVENLTASHPDQFALATCAEDIITNKTANKISFAMGIENGGAIEGSIANLEHFFARGVRYITLAHSKFNHLSDSSYDTNEHWQGLSPFGKKVIADMNRLGVMVDVSHISDKALQDVLAISQAPVIASHSSLRHFTPGFHRNLDDASVIAIAATGGVIQINFGSNFLTQEAQAWSKTYAAERTAFIESLNLKDGEQLLPNDQRLLAFGKKYREESPYAYASSRDVIDHIDRVVTLAGIDYVGIGSDYDGVGDSLPLGLKDAAEYPNLTLGLLERGYSQDDIRKILGGNILRVWKSVEQHALSLGGKTRCTQ